MNNNIQNNNNPNDNLTPYRASSNLNTAISNPTVNINDPMNVNIQNSTMPPRNSAPYSNPMPEANYAMPSQNAPRQEAVVPPVNNQVKEYTSLDNKRPKKKKLSINIGSEFKIALLIVVILLVFIFILPMITDLFKAF